MKDNQQKFLEKVDTSGGPNSCWEWQGYKSPFGYGRVGAKGFGLDRYYELTHRISYTLFKGDIPDGAYVCHRCDNPPCVNPDHLFLGDAKANSADRAAKGRNDCRVGKKNPQSKLNDDTVKLILESPETGKALSKKLGVAESSISQIRSGRVWTHVKAKRPERDGRKNLKRFFSGLNPTDEGLEMAERYKSGESRDNLAERYATTPETITRTLEAMGVKRRSGGLPKKPLIFEGVKYPGVLAAMRATGRGHGYITKNAEFIDG